MTRITQSLEEYRQEVRNQGTGPKLKVCMVCPACKTVQNAQDLLNAGAGSTFEEVEKYLGFSCVGRFTHGLPPKSEKNQFGCNWTLGGLFSIHELEVVTPDGQVHPIFKLATKTEALEHIAKQETTREAV